MITCEFCERFINAKWRIKDDADEGKKKKPSLRHCNIANKYLNGKHEKCDHFVPCSIFWCDRNECFMHTGVCITRSKQDDVCFHCPKAPTVMDVHKLRKMYERKQKALEEQENRPTLLKRKAVE